MPSSPNRSCKLETLPMFIDHVFVGYAESKLRKETSNFLPYPINFTCRKGLPKFNHESRDSDFFVVEGEEKALGTQKCKKGGTKLNKNRRDKFFRFSDSWLVPTWSITGHGFKAHFKFDRRRYLSHSQCILFIYCGRNFFRW